MSTLCSALLLQLAVIVVALIVTPVIIFKNILAPLLTKTTEFEVKNRYKSAEEAKAGHLL